MLKATILLVLGLVPVVLCVMLIFKNFLSQYKMNYRGALALLVIALALASLIYSLSAIIGAMGLQNTIKLLDSSPKIPQDEIDVLTKSIPLVTRDTIKYLIIGYVLYILDFILVKKINKKIQIEIENNTSKRWNLK